jgi:hypothetical protein
MVHDPYPEIAASASALHRLLAHLWMDHESFLSFTTIVGSFIPYLYI